MRYEKIKFDKIDNGLSVIDNEFDSLSNFSLVTLDNENKLILANDYDTIIFDNDMSGANFFVFGSDFYVLVQDSSTLRVKLYKSTDGITFSLNTTLPVQFDSYSRFFDCGNNTCIVECSGNIYNVGTGATYSGFSLSAESLTFCNGFYYFVDQDGYLIKFKDFSSNGTPVLQLPYNNLDTFIVNYEGFLIVNHGDEQVTIIDPLSLTFNYVPESFRIDDFLIKNNNFFWTKKYSNNRTIFYKYSGYSEKILDYNFGERVYPFDFIDNCLYIYGSVSGKIYKFDTISFKLFYINTFLNANSAYCLIYNDKFYFFDQSTIPAKEAYLHYSDGYILTAGYAETNLINKDTISPKAIILYHYPLPSGCTVKLYASQNFGAYSLILTSNTLGSTKKEYIFPKNSSVDFIKFKIELLTTNVSNSPSKIKLNFLYQPLGLENSK